MEVGNRNRKGDVKGERKNAGLIYSQRQRQFQQTTTAMGKMTVVTFVIEKVLYVWSREERTEKSLSL